MMTWWQEASQTIDRMVYLLMNAVIIAITVPLRMMRPWCWQGEFMRGPKWRSSPRQDRQHLSPPSKLDALLTHVGKLSRRVEQRWAVDHVIHKINVLTITLQLYIVTGGHSSSNLASTEILKKGGGHSWQTVASLPSGRHHLRGVSLANGHFMVSGEE